MLIVYCTLAGMISAWAISGLLVMVDFVSGTSPGTFFATIGLSLGFNDPISAQYIGFGLHILTGMSQVTYSDSWHYSGEN